LVLALIVAGAVEGGIEADTEADTEAEAEEVGVVVDAQLVTRKKAVNFIIGFFIV
jgi:hypothetical protein